MSCDEKKRQKTFKTRTVFLKRKSYMNFTEQSSIQMHLTESQKINRQLRSPVEKARK